MMMLDPALLEELRQSKNLLAFSAGIDSTALFFLLQEQQIPFDIAFVNYHTRPQSNEEALYAKKLAENTHKTLYIHDASLSQSRYEEEARKIRYSFFEELIEEHGYHALLTAHQLNDQLEWFLMQLGKGAGTLELLGMQKIVKRSDYTLYRPLLDTSKEELQAYLDGQGHHYFIDESNADQNFKRNFIRHNFSDLFLKHYKEGVVKSFAYIQEDAHQLLGDYTIQNIDQLTLIQSNSIRTRLYLIDKELKKRGYILSADQREALASDPSVVIGGKYCIEHSGDKSYIAPFIEEVTMPKTFKESCRLAKLPLKLRPFLFLRGIDITRL